MVRPSLATLREDSLGRPALSLDSLEEPPPPVQDTVCRNISEVQQLPPNWREESRFELVVTQVKNPEHFWFNIYEDSEDGQGRPVHYGLFGGETSHTN